MRSYWGDEIFLWIALLAIEIGGVGWYWNPSEIDTSVQWTQGVSLHGHIRTLERTLPISDGNSDLIWLSSEVRKYHMPTVCWENTTHCFELKPQIQLQ